MRPCFPTFPPWRPKKPPGPTFSYEIPGLRTISLSFTKRRFRIAAIPLKNINLSYMLVPKIRPTAFLKARLLNSSTVSLLRGHVGVTLDGSFLGNTTLPRCSASETFSLSLGVDPAVNVSYSKPVVKRSSTGMLFQKDENVTYTRTCTITNTKPTRAVEGALLDQVPVSQEEKFWTVIVRPAGLSEEGSARPDGKRVTKDGKADLSAVASAESSSSWKQVPAWGKASAMLKPRGEVRWGFKIEPGKGARFVLEYETQCPNGEKVVAA